MNKEAMQNGMPPTVGTEAAQKAPIQLNSPLESHFSFTYRIYYCLYIFNVILYSAVYALYLSTWWFFKSFFQKPLSVRGKVCFVTGSGRGLGREICLALAKEGAILACADVNEVINSETLHLLKEIGAKAKCYKLNVADKQEVEKIARLVEKDLGPVYLLVNNAAIVMPPRELTEEFVRASYNVNVLGYYWVMQAFLPFFLARDEGHILNICSAGSLSPDYDLDIYCSTKAAIRSLTQTLYTRLNVQGSNIKVSIIHPYMMNTAKEYDARMKLKSWLRPLSMSYVLEDIIGLVKSGQFEVTSPSYFKAALIIGQLLPPECLTIPRKMMIRSLTFYENEEYENTATGHVVRLCS